MHINRKDVTTAYLIVCAETAIRDDGELFAKVTCVNIGHKVLITEHIVRRACVQQDPVWVDDEMVLLGQGYYRPNPIVCRFLLHHDFVHRSYRLWILMSAERCTVL